MMTITRRLAGGVVGATLLSAMAGTVSPVAAHADGPLFNGTYSVAPYGDLVHVSSDCGGCDATGVGQVAVHLTWNGAGWTRAYVDQCGPVTGTLLPTVVTDGAVQEGTLASTGGCAGAVTAVWSRVGP